MEIDGIYEGAIENEQKNGTGCYLWHNGNFYNGEWKNNQINGKGTLYFSNGGLLTGSFLNGKLTGWGKGMYSNGDMYIGSWKDGFFHGRGVFYHKLTDDWKYGEFREGALTNSIKSGKQKPSSLSNKNREFLL